MNDNIKILKALSDETRFMIVEFLLDGEKCVCEIMPHVKRTASTVSLQLTKLENASVLNSRRDGKRVYYSINNKIVLKIMNLLNNKLVKK